MKANLGMVRWCALSACLAVGLLSTRAESWERRSDGPGQRAGHSLVLAGEEIIVFGGGREGSFLNDGAIHDLRTDTWRPISQDGAPTTRWFHTAVWTGTEMIVWGGRPNFFSTGHRVDGARYNPRTDSWRPMSTVNAPTPRAEMCWVWTGRELVVWGGHTDGAVELNDGGRYDPETDIWHPIRPSPLAGRFDTTAIWTGTEMIFWGGVKVDNYLQAGEFWASFGDGAAYNPRTDAWRLLNTQGGPGSRTTHTTVWTGTEMLVWGGRFLPDYTFPTTGAAYNPQTDSWRPIETHNAPPPRAGHTAVWSGTEMIVFGGWFGPAGPALDTGGRYNLATGEWTPTTMVNVPQRRFWGVLGGGVWTGRAMFIYGGWDYPTELNTAYLYHPASALRLLEQLISDVSNLGLPRKTERPLLASLHAALNSLEHGSDKSAANQLQAFQQKVQSQLGLSHPEIAQSLIDAAQAIIDRLEPAED